MPTVLLTGSSGMIGTALIKQLTKNGYGVKALVRDRKKANGFDSFYWNYLAKEIDDTAFTDVDYIINLAGANISKRWTKKYKKEIQDSRVKSTNFLFETIKNKNIKLKKFISVSATGYYGSSATLNLKEDAPAGNDFLATVCHDWEDAARQLHSISIPTCIFRQGVVITAHGGFVKVVSLPIKYYVGAHLGTGKQFISWIALSDLCDLYIYAMQNENIVGTFNATSSRPLTMEEIDNAMATFYHKIIWLPNIPSWALKLVLGELAGSVLGSYHTSNGKIKDSGFVLKYEDFGKALEQ